MEKLKIRNKIKNFFKKVDRGDLNLFFICFFVSLILWFLVKLSKEYNDEITFSLKYIDIPKNLISLDEKAYDKVTLKVRSSGFNILSYKLYNHIVEIDLRDILRKNYTPFDNIFWELNKGVFSSNKDFEGLYVYDIVSPRVIYFNNIKLKKKKKVPIRIIGDIKPAIGYTIKEKILLYPDSIEVEGSYEDIDDIEEIFIKKVKFKNISQDLGKNIPLNIPDRLKSKTNQAHIEVLVEELIEKEIKINITIKNFSKNNYTVKVIPESVSVIFNIGESKYEEVNIEDFEANLNFEGIDENVSKPIKINVSSKKNIEIIRVFPEVAEYIIKKK